MPDERCPAISEDVVPRIGRRGPSSIPNSKPVFVTVTEWETRGVFAAPGHKGLASRSSFHFGPARSRHATPSNRALSQLNILALTLPLKPYNLIYTSSEESLFPFLDMGFLIQYGGSHLSRARFLAGMVR